MAFIKLDYTVSQSKWVSSEQTFALRPLKRASSASSRPSSVPNPPGYLAPFTAKQSASASSKVIRSMGYKWLKLSWNICRIAFPSKWGGARKASSKIHRIKNEEGMGPGLIVSGISFHLSVPECWYIPTIRPAKSLPMQAIMLYFSGSGIQIFSLGMIFMLLTQPISAVLNIFQGTFFLMVLVQAIYTIT